MNVDEVLEIVDQLLPSEQFGPVERLILRQSWLGHTYGEMAQDSGYGSDYLKEAGSQLWHNFSEALGKRVTKKNLHLILNSHPLDRNEEIGSPPQERQGNITPDKPRFPSGPVPLNSPMYIDRPPIEELAYSEIAKPGCVVRIKAPRKMGKSSLLNRLVAHARAEGYKTVYLDFQEADEAVFASLDKFLRWFCTNVSRQLNLDPRLDDYWDGEIGSKVSCRIYFEGYLLERIDCPLILAFNEVNRVFEHPSIAQDFLPMLRYWHEQAQQVDAWQKLRLVVVHTTESYVQLKIDQSPFNIGLSLHLPPFSIEQVQDLARRYGLNSIDGSEVRQLMAMVGGHPYLVSIALYHLYQEDMTLEALLETAPTQTGIYRYHLRDYLTILRDEPQLSIALQQVLTAEDESVQLGAIIAYKLESMGLIELDGDRARPSCELYRLYFHRQLNGETWLDADPKACLLFSSLDELTGLPTRPYVNQYLEIEWQHWVKEMVSVSLILCDIDYFRFYSDAYGHSVGNTCLQQIAKIISDCTSPQAAIVARYGDDEFAVILPQIEAAEAVEIAETIRDIIRILAISNNQSKVITWPHQLLTISVGIATTIPSPRILPAMLIAATEEALSQAKKQGRDRVIVSSSFSN